MSTALATIDETAITQWQTSELDIIKKQIAPGIPNEELALFARVCQRTGLDPFARQIYDIQRGGKWTIQTGIDGYRLIAARTCEYAGNDEPVYDTEDADNPAWAKVTVWRIIQGQRYPFTGKAKWREYAQLRDGQPTGMWAKMPFQMLAKCAESLALRKAFPAELSGLYTDDEMTQADNPPPHLVVQQQRYDDAQDNPTAPENALVMVNAGSARFLLQQSGYKTVVMQNKVLESTIGVKQQYTQAEYQRLEVAIRDLQAKGA